MLFFVHGMGAYNKDYWLPWASKLLPELAALGLFLRQEDCYGIFYDDLVPCQNHTEYKNELRALAQTEFESYKASDPALQSLGPLVKKWAEAVVDSFGDIFNYLYVPKAHQEVNKRVYQVLARARAPVTLIGYSLGSLVGYCALQENPQAARSVGHLILVGSPLYWFKHGVGQHVDFTLKPRVGRFTNIAGILDIAWPQKVAEVVAGLDQDVHFLIDPLNPIRGHRKYWEHRKSLALIAQAVVRGWKSTVRPPA